MTHEIPATCPECDGTDLKWVADTVSGTPPAPHLRAIPKPRLALGCVTCSATVVIVTGEGIIDLLPPPHVVPFMRAWEVIAPLVLSATEVDDDPGPDLSPIRTALKALDKLTLLRLGAVATELARAAQEAYSSVVVAEMPSPARPAGVPEGFSSFSQDLK
jgi:hypothetical protein